MRITTNNFKEEDQYNPIPMQIHITHYKLMKSNRWGEDLPISVFVIVVLAILVDVLLAFVALVVLITCGLAPGGTAL